MICHQSGGYPYFIQFICREVYDSFIQSYSDEGKVTPVLLPKPFGNSHTNQMLSSMVDMGLIYKNRWGRYSFAVPLFDRFIHRQADSIEPHLEPQPG